MRIERIALENINSLAGRFEIDFEDNAFKDGLFAIVGPSGSGKTTVLDAICLALYGRTPRISKISENRNEIMNKNTDFCRAEAVFSSSGVRYKALFYQERSKASSPFKKAKRELHMLGADGGWQPLTEGGITEMDAKVVEITGLDFTRFTRSMMLAQFRFAEFLRASSNERAAILEQITDIGIYRRISMAVFERTKQQETQLNELQMKMENINVLPKEQNEQYEKELRLLINTIPEHIKVKDSLSRCLNLYNDSIAIKEKLSEVTKKQPNLEFAEQTAQSKLDVAEKYEREQTKAYEELAQILKSVRALDIKILAQQKNTRDIEEQLKKDKDQIKAHKNIIFEIYKKYYPNEKDEFYRKLFDSSNAGEVLRQSAYSDLEKANKIEKRLLDKANALLEGHDEVYWKQRLKLLGTGLQLEEANSEKSKAQAEIEQQVIIKTQIERQSREKTNQMQLAQRRYDDAQVAQRFIDERLNLVQGNPCPLCGARTHPYVGSELGQSFIDEARTQLEEAQKEISELHLNAGANDNRIADLNKILAEKTKLIETKSYELSQLGGLETLDDISLEINKTSELLERYDVLQKEQRKADQNIKALTLRFADADKDAEVLLTHRQIIDEIALRFKERETEKNNAYKAAKLLLGQRREIFGDKNADDEEFAARGIIREAQQEKKRHQQDAQEARRLAENNRNEIARMLKSKDENDYAVKKEYTKSLAASAGVANVFADKSFITHYEAFAKAAEQLAGAINEKELKAAIDAINKLISEEDAQRGAIGQLLKSDELNKDAIGLFLAEEKKLKQTLRKWDRLNKLIGSKDGDKFCRIAQGITFDALIAMTNTVLSRMSDRYILLRDKSMAAKPLELSVVDNYQAGEVRPVDNLSGGESFIVSLALALGLSEMSAGAARIDSLFIDEGFASLDDRYMESALQTLLTLGSREGKIIGVISHVDALKERIDVKIEVESLTGGRSTLFGPGVKAGLA